MSTTSTSTNLTFKTALDISTGPAHFSDRRASIFYLSVARTGHLDIRRAIRFQIVLVWTMTNHSMYFSLGRRPKFRQFRAVLLLQRDASMAWVRAGSNYVIVIEIVIDYAKTV